MIAMIAMIAHERQGTIMITQITIEERKGTIERGNTFDIRQENESGYACRIEERKNYEQACALARQWAQEHGFTYYSTSRFTETPGQFRISTVLVATGKVVDERTIVPLW